MKKEKPNRYIDYLKLLTRVIGILLILVIFSQAIGQGISSYLDLSPREVGVVLSVVFMIFGMIISYGNHLFGAILIIFGYVFYALLKGSVFPDSVYPLFLFIGGINIYLWWKTR